ncbi:sugar ABC transporter ATP-binding protein [Nonomuraea sp. NPDC050556]|uniref:sugar ABC transporter ATP-binding protein n=1 Tax=Nonomuraea sp. NPDC050556 TaxID=3364369 RepID=UPI003796F403
MYVASEVSKRFGGVVALDRASISVAPGTVHALLGENGAGKSTLVRILSGALPPDTGSLLLDGSFRIAVVSQELNLFPDLTVLDNLFPAPRGLYVDRRALARRAGPVLASLEFGRPVDTLVGSLSLAERQLVEIARALLTDPSVLILDEPTSALQADAVARLLRVLAALRARQVAVVYVSHLLEEVVQLCDVVTVLRDGRNVLSGVPMGELTLDTIVHAMLGDQPSRGTAGVSTSAGLSSSGLILRGVHVAGALGGVDLEARPGEIIGLAGLAGAGQSAVLDVVCGVRGLSAGEVVFPGGQPAPRNLRAAIRAGVAVVPSDRKRLGLMLDKPVWENVAQVQSVALGRTGRLLRAKDLRARAAAAIARLRIRTSGPDQLTGQLSGGNQQKVVFAKWLETAPGIVLLDDPTRGVDIGATAEMHDIIRSLAAEGRIVLMTSTDLGELVELCDRVLVFRRGQITASLTAGEITEHEILHIATTGSRNGTV